MAKRLYGLLQNRLMETTKAPKPEVGMGATVIMYSDRHACTIVDVKEKEITVQYDMAKDREPYANSWEITRNPNGRKEIFTLRRNGKWIKAGDETKDYGSFLLIGERDHHFDYEF